ncbi:MAG TPA: hypothetical protein VK395_22830 [Gemmataceae bacterium]|nr:hypothetical protein [Gemmataceae bacterium]
MVCLEHGLQLEWQADRCRFRPLGGNWEELTDVNLRKSGFRALLARVAALCNERTPNSVSPYGGRGELSLGEDSGAVFRVTLVNTPAAQKLELLALAGRPAEAAQQRQVAEAYRKLVLKYHADARRPALGSELSDN